MRICYSCMMVVLYLRVIAILYRLIWRLTLLETRRPHQQEKNETQKRNKYKHIYKWNSNNKIQQQINSRVNSLSFIFFSSVTVPPVSFFFNLLCVFLISKTLFVQKRSLIPSLSFSSDHALSICAVCLFKRASERMNMQVLNVWWNCR